VTALLEVDGLSAGYGDITAIWDVSLSVAPGQVTVVLGRNGAGKTTTLLTIAGILKMRAGSVRFKGEDISRRQPSARTRLGISLVQENKRIFRQRTVEQNLQIGAYCLPRRERAASIADAYERFPVLAERRGERAGALSGGQQQMLAIAQALASRPTVLMIDEPSGGLAPVIVRDVMNTIRELRSEGLGIILVEQLVDQALGMADDLVVLDNGRVVVSRPAGELGDTNELRDVYLGIRPPTPSA
jgi:branched-chain amino acid transport system ATP-binding protein